MANYTLRLRQGDFFTESVTYGGSDPIDLTGSTFEWWIKVGAFEETYTSSPEIVVDVDPTTGRFSISLSSALTATLETGRGRHYLRITDSGGHPTTVLIGDVDVDFN